MSVLKINDKVYCKGITDYSLEKEQRQFLKSKKPYIITDIYKTKKGYDWKCKLEGAGDIQFYLFDFNLIKDPNFKAGSIVKWNGFSSDVHSPSLVKKEEKFLKSKETHIVTRVSEQFCYLEGSDINFRFDMLDLIKEPDFKVKDRVIWKDNIEYYSSYLGDEEERKKFLKSNKVHTISLVCSDDTCKLEGSDFWFGTEIFELEEENKKRYENNRKNLKIGDNVKVGNNNNWQDETYKFHFFDTTLDYPYIVKSITKNGRTFVTSFKNCRKIKYKAYKEPKFDWIGLTIQDMNKFIYYISSIGKDFVILNDGTRCSFDDLVEGYTFNDIPFGEEIKQDDEKF